MKRGNQSAITTRPQQYYAQKLHYNSDVTKMQWLRHCILTKIYCCFTHKSCDVTTQLTCRISIIFNFVSSTNSSWGELPIPLSTGWGGSGSAPPTFPRAGCLIVLLRAMPLIIMPIVPTLRVTRSGSASAAAKSRQLHIRRTFRTTGCTSAQPLFQPTATYEETCRTLQLVEKKVASARAQLHTECKQLHLVYCTLQFSNQKQTRPVNAGLRLESNIGLVIRNGRTHR